MLLRRSRAESSAELAGAAWPPPEAVDELWLPGDWRCFMCRADWQLSLPSSPVPPPSLQQDLGEICLVGAERMVERRKKRNREDWSKGEIRECYASLEKKSPLRPGKQQFPVPEEGDTPP